MFSFTLYSFFLQSALLVSKLLMATNSIYKISACKKSKENQIEERHKSELDLDCLFVRILWKLSVL